MSILFWIFIFYANAYHAKESGVQFKSLANVKSGWAFQGHLSENERIVKLNPELRGIPVENVSQSMEICGVFLEHESGSIVPFIFKIINKKWGNIEVRLKENINFQDLADRYTFQIEIYDCDQPPHFSERKFLLIEIRSVNGPKFMRSYYHFTVNTSLPVGTKIGEIVAIERPIDSKSDQGICKYDILPANSVPFTIDQYGSLHIQKIVITPNVFNKYRFYVRATDCDKQQPRISSVPVVVEVHDSCTPHWNGLPNNIKYIRNSGVIPLISMQFPSPSLHICSSSCSNFNIVLTARLLGNKLKIATPEICKQDLQSIKKQEILCDASVDAINLLRNAPSSMVDNNVGGYFFSSSHIPVESNLDNSNHLFGKTFSLTFWMKHENMILNDPKQQILCNSDIHVMNRHHYSLFLHNCKLILLIRKEYSEINQDKYQPTEWRYGPLKEVCDNKWHHYAITFNDGNPMLQIDGEIYLIAPELLVEKPLQKLHGNINGTRLTVGSCYHSKTNNYVQNFIGHLAGMRLIKKYVEAVNTVRCMATCGESLLLPHIVEVIELDSSVTMFSQYVIIRSNNMNDLQLMFSKLSYINTNALSEVYVKEERQRNISIDTEIKCHSKENVKISKHNIAIDIIESISKTGIISNQDLSSIEIYSQSKVKGFVKKPIELFPDVKFIKINGGNTELKSCIIRPINYLIRSWEYINWPVAMAIDFHLTSLNDSHGLILEGTQPIEVYQLLLRKITFVTLKFDPQNEDRKFGLICKIKGKKITNDQIVTVQVKEEDLSTYYIVDDQEYDKNDLSDKSQVLHAGNDRQGFDDKLLSRKQKKTKLSHTGTIVLSVVLSILFVGCIVLGTVVYCKKRRSNNMKSNRKSDSNSSHKLMNLVPRKVDMCHPPNEVASDEDVNSITSDCPESCEDHEFDENDQFHKYCEEDENVSESNNSRIEIPKYMNLPNKSWAKQFNEPVDV